MAISKKSTAVTKPAAKATSKPAAKAAPVADEVMFEPITVQRTFLEGGERNESDSETLEHVSFPMNAKVAKVAVMVGTSEDYGAVKASVTVSVPCFIEELDDAAAFATEKAKSILDELAELTAAPEEEPEAPAKRGVSSTKKPGKAEPEEEEPEAEAGEVEVELFEEDELEAMDEDDLKALCETWEIEWPKSKKPNVAKAGAIASILEKQAEYAEAEDGEEPEAEGGEEAEIGPEDIEAMDRKQVEAFLAEYNESVDEDDQLEVDLSEYPKTKGGLKTLKEELISALFSE